MGIHTELGVRSILVFDEVPTGTGGDLKLPSAIRALRDQLRTLARLKDQRSKPRIVHEALMQIHKLLLSSNCTFEYDDKEHSELVLKHVYPSGFLPFPYANSLPVLQAIQRTLLDVWEVGYKSGKFKIYAFI